MYIYVRIPRYVACPGDASWSLPVLEYAAYLRMQYAVNGARNAYFNKQDNDFIFR
jgi:hypothetical protein